ncbi:MAG: agmatine deiminase family protein [Methanotrichaceae archaeon]|nr:agmatine deiminase family protein [Methanotrichaceae archaeon]
MKQGRVKVGLIQTTVSKDFDFNTKNALDKAEKAIANGAKIICLPELYRTTYFPQFEDTQIASLAEAIPGESTRAFSALAKENEVVIIVPIFEKDESGYYNSVAVIDADGSLLETYRKIHVPHDPLFYEQSYFQPGSEFRIYDTRHARFAVLICYDQWFPEAARIAVLNGAEIIFYPTAIGWIRGEEEPSEGNWHDAWETVQRGHAIANGVHVAAVNRVGREEDLHFWGGSFVCDSFGRILARASDREEEVLVVELDLAMNEEVREGWGFFRNRRPDVYWPIVELRQQPVVSEPKAELCLKDTPLQLGYHMPAEWEKHDAIWLSWPYDLDSFPEIDQVEQTYISIIKAIHEGELVNLLVKDEPMLNKVVELLREADINLKQVRFHVLNYADVWFRDYGPTFVVNREAGKLAMVNWIFNAWGEKYVELMVDTRIPCLINDDLKLECFQPGIVLEGGSIDVNGCGTVLTTEQCLLNKNRNPGLEKEDIETYLREYLGVSKIIWLKQGIAGDDTDGHIDDIARFVDPTTVLCAYEDNPDDENYLALKENYELLSSSTDQDGQKLKVIKLPMPGEVGEERRLPASYANFYIGNEAVLVPVFGHKNDKEALRIIQEAFPNRKVVGINCREMVSGLGTIHCVSQQQPAL